MKLDCINQDSSLAFFPQHLTPSSLSGALETVPVAQTRRDSYLRFLDLSEWMGERGWAKSQLSIRDRRLDFAIASKRLVHHLRVSITDIDGCPVFCASHLRAFIIELVFKQRLLLVLD